MKFCVFGAGAIGGFVGGMLSRGGADVSLVARGRHLAAIRTAGLQVVTPTENFTVNVPATDKPEDLGVQDVIFLSTKAYSLIVASEAIQPLIGPETTVVSAQNGIPFWYFYGLGNNLEGHTLQTVDPGGKIASAIGNHRVIGCVITSSNTVEAPGVVRNLGNRVFVLGEPDKTHSRRLTEIATLFEIAGLLSPIGLDIRSELWVKMWGNVSFSSMAVLTLSKLGPLVETEDLKALAIKIMEETQAVGEALGVKFNTNILERIEGTRRVSEHKTSILQDLEAGRPMEVDGITGAVAELGRLLNVKTPMIDLVYALMRQRAREEGLYPQIGINPFAS